MKKLLFFVWIPIFFIACEEDSAVPVKRLTDDSDVELVSDIRRFNSIKNSLNSDPFDIRQVIREDDLIKVVVQYSGGCQSHEFEVLWNQDFDELDNEEFGYSMTELLITHNANGDLCEAAITDTLTIALNDINSEIDWELYAVRLLNGSKDQSFVAFPFIESIQESEFCMMEVEMERVICGDGLLGNVWFKYAEQNYLQPASIATFMLIDPDLPEGLYRVGVKVSTWVPDTDTGICAAFPGYAVPVEIWCLEKVE